MSPERLQTEVDPGFSFICLCQKRSKLSNLGAPVACSARVYKLYVTVCQSNWSLCYNERLLARNERHTTQFYINGKVLQVDCRILCSCALQFVLVASKSVSPVMIWVCLQRKGTTQPLWQEGKENRIQVG